VCLPSVHITPHKNTIVSFLLLQESVLLLEIQLELSEQSVQLSGVYNILRALVVALIRTHSSSFKCALQPLRTRYG